MDHSDSQYKEGDRIAQLIIVALPWVEVEEVKELSSSQRGKDA
jgi:dUTPase